MCTMGGLTALHYAAVGGHEEAAALLCSYGTDIYKRALISTLDPSVSTDVGSTVLHYAAAYGRCAACRQEHTDTRLPREDYGKT